MGWMCWAATPSCVVDVVDGENECQGEARRSVCVGRRGCDVCESKSKRETGFEPVTLRAAIESSTTELPARRNTYYTPTPQTTLGNSPTTNLTSSITPSPLSASPLTLLHPVGRSRNPTTHDHPLTTQHTHYTPPTHRTAYCDRDHTLLCVA